MQINGLIDKREFWRHVMSSFFHANVAHLMVCFEAYGMEFYSCSAMSYWFSKLPAVGASGAICGSVGSLAVFVTRHRDISGHGREDLQHIAQTIGLLYKGIDNWGHVSISLFLSLCVYVKFLPYKYENGTGTG
ncbi:hypothetical protein Patl1_35529 [Pistacia atlantica]|nr:hypothetical protein Patl1_35529 [Pistacia atlantica]